MTDDQWSYITAKLAALELLSLSIARSMPLIESIREQFCADLEEQRTAYLNSGHTDQHVENTHKQAVRLLAAL